MIREINVKELTDNISEMCIQANHYLSPDMDVCMKHNRNFFTVNRYCNFFTDQIHSQFRVFGIFF